MKTLFKNSILIGIIVIISLLLVSCSSSGGTVVSSTPDTNGEIIDTQSGEAQPVDTTESQPGESEQTNVSESEVPEDLPIMPGARKLSVTTNGTNISYEVDGTIDDVVGFYQEELPNL